MSGMSMFSFVGCMVLLGISLLWFKPVMDLFNEYVVPIVPMPEYLILFLKLLPFAVLAICLITAVMRLMKRGSRDDFFET